MQKLKTNLLAIALLILITGCKTQPQYEIRTYPRIGKYDDLHILKISPRRIIHECMDFHGKAENSWRHHYYMQILTDKNTVIIAQHPTDQGIDECTEHLQKIETILKKADVITMCLRGEFRKIDSDDDRLYDFKDLGKYQGSYHTPDLDSVCNSKECYSINEIWIDTCPGFTKH